MASLGASQLRSSLPGGNPCCLVLVSTIRNKDACKLTPKIVLWTFPCLACFLFTLYLEDPALSVAVSLAVTAALIVFQRQGSSGAGILSTQVMQCSHNTIMSPLPAPTLPHPLRTEKAGLCLKHCYQLERPTNLRLSIATLYWKSSVS